MRDETGIKIFMDEEVSSVECSSVVVSCWIRRKKKKRGRQRLSGYSTIRSFETVD